MNVDWKNIAQRAEANGLRVAGFTDQHHFLSGIISRLDHGCSGQAFMPLTSKAKRQLQTLLHPEMLGRAFQVLALAKGVSPEAPQLAGFKFATEPRSILNLDDFVEYGLLRISSAAGYRRPEPSACAIPLRRRIVARHGPTVSEKRECSCARGDFRCRSSGLRSRLGDFHDLLVALYDRSRCAVATTDSI
jgi:hypothetical protein